MELKNRLLTRFLRYAAIPSQSRAGADTVPSTPGQWDLAKLLCADLKELGLTDIVLSEKCVVTAHLPARLPEDHCPVPAVGWVAHLDTVDVCLSPVVNPKLIRNYPGGDICQNSEKGIYLSPRDYPELERYIGQDILVSDGTSVLGADNKAAIANIMVAI